MKAGAMGMAQKKDMKAGGKKSLKSEHYLSAVSAVTVEKQTQKED
jgi:hypothetical protein